MVSLHEDDLIKTRQLDWQIIRRLSYYMRPQILSLTLVLLFLLIITVIELTTVYLMGEALDLYIRPFENMGEVSDVALISAAKSGLVQTVVIVVSLYFVQAFLTYFQMTLLVNAGQHIIAFLRMDLFAHVQQLPALFYDRTPTGKVVTRLTNDVNNIHEAFSGVIVYLAKDLFLMVGIVIMMLTVSWELGLVLLFPLPLIIGSSLIFRILNRKAFAKIREVMSKLNSFMHESFAGIETIKVFLQESRRSAQFQQMNEDGFKANVHSIFINSVFIPLVGFFVALPTALLLWYGGGQILAGVITLGLFFMMISYLRMFYEPIADFSQKYILMQMAMASAERIFQLMDTPIESTEKIDEYVMSIDVHTGIKIEFRHVSFSYDKVTPILKDVSFILEPGKTLALVGGTGSGKTTITALLCRFYELDAGMILVNDVDIQTLSLSELRHYISIIMQEPFVFSRSIMENIRLDSQEISEQIAITAAETIGANRFIEALSDKYDTHLSERGANLSAGERQLLVFTRAMAHNRPLMILDEATASIDSVTEFMIQQAILKLLCNRTSIVVAHRLSTIRHANHILVLQHGEIVESGTHESLLTQKGLYANMVEEQFNIQKVETAL